MNDDSFVVIGFCVILIMGAFFLGLNLGKNSWKKPCDQFTQWQYDLGYVPYKCAPEFKEVNE